MSTGDALSDGVAFALKHATIQPPEDGDGHGARWTEGGYNLVYTTKKKTPLHLGSPSSYKLWLRIKDQRPGVDVTTVPSGHAIGLQRLKEFLRQVRALNRWGTTVECTLVVEKDGVETPSDPVFVQTPARPVSACDLEAFTADGDIRYCGDFESKRYYGRNLFEIDGSHYFTYKGILETNPDLRGFACIGLAGNIYRVRPGPVKEKDEATGKEKVTDAPYERGEEMAAHLHGQTFLWRGERPKGTFFAGSPVHSKYVHDLEVEAGAVVMGKYLLPEFLDQQRGKGEWYLIWIQGHAGLIWDGFLYECKPPGHGFTKEEYPAEHHPSALRRSTSAVRKFTAADLRSEEIGLRWKRYRLSKLRPP